MKRMPIFTVAVIGLSIAQPASAAIYCVGTIDTIYVDRFGGVIINGSWRNGYTKVCSISSEWKSVSANVCVTWLSLLSAARTMSQVVQLAYGSGNCATLATYDDAPNPTYVMLKD